jgi:hypothetical protein
LLIREFRDPPYIFYTEVAMKDMINEPRAVFEAVINAIADMYGIEPSEVDIVLGFRKPNSQFFNWVSSIEHHKTIELHKGAIKAMTEYEASQN